MLLFTFHGWDFVFGPFLPSPGLGDWQENTTRTISNKSVT
jgi:hypothetical protein